MVNTNFKLFSSSIPRIAFVFCTVS